MSMYAQVLEDQTQAANTHGTKGTDDDLTNCKEIAEFLREEAVDKARRRGESDGRARIPDGSSGHPPFIDELLHKGAVALEMAGRMRERCDADLAMLQHEAYVQRIETVIEGDAVGDDYRRFIALSSWLAAVAIGYLALHELETLVLRAVIALVFGVVFVAMGCMKTLLEHDVADDELSAPSGKGRHAPTLIAAVACTAIGVAAQQADPFSLANLGKSIFSITVVAVLALIWVTLRSTVHTIPILRQTIASERRRRHWIEYMNAMEARRSSWEDHTRQGWAIIERARELMDVYYAENLISRRNSLTPGVQQTARQPLPQVPPASWLSYPAPDFNPHKFT